MLNDSLAGILNYSRAEFSLPRSPEPTVPQAAHLSSSPRITTKLSSGGAKRATSVNTPLPSAPAEPGGKIHTISREIEPVRRSFCRLLGSSGMWCLRMLGLKIIVYGPSKREGVGASRRKLIWARGFKTSNLLCLKLLCFKTSNLLCLKFAMFEHSNQTNYYVLKLAISLKRHLPKHHVPETPIYIYIYIYICI